MSSNKGLDRSDKITIIGIVLATIIGIAGIIVTIIIGIVPEYLECIILNKCSEPENEKVLCPLFIGPEEEIDESCDKSKLNEN